jgi:hypothetical protein
VALGRVAAPLLVAGAALGALPACSKRTVFLVPPLGAVSQDGGRGGPREPVDAGHPRQPAPDARPVPPLDAGTHDADRLACETRRIQQQPQPLGIYVMMDKSNAMVAPWLEVSHDLEAFISQLNTLSAVSMGIQFYPLSPPIISPGAMCDPTQYATPETAIDLLPDNQLALIASITNHSPNAISPWVTPTESPTDAALQGAILGARSWVNAHDAEHPKAVVLLVTTGVPSSAASPVCQPAVANVEAVAKDGVSSPTGEPSVPTYVLAVGSASDDLNAIAAAGGTNEAFLKSSGGTVLDVLLHIRDVALPCDVDVSASELSGDRINVELDAPGVPSKRYGRVGALSECAQVAPGSGAWYIDGAGSSAKLRLCPTTCEEARAVPAATLDVIFGCLTYSIPIQ